MASINSRLDKTKSLIINRISFKKNSDYMHGNIAMSNREIISPSIVSLHDMYDISNKTFSYNEDDTTYMSPLGCTIPTMTLHYNNKTGLSYNTINNIGYNFAYLRNPASVSSDISDGIEAIQLDTTTLVEKIQYPLISSNSDVSMSFNIGSNGKKELIVSIGSITTPEPVYIMESSEVQLLSYTSDESVLYMNGIVVLMEKDSSDKYHVYITDDFFSFYHYELSRDIPSDVTTPYNYILERYLKILPNKSFIMEDREIINSLNIINLRNTKEVFSIDLNRDVINNGLFVSPSPTGDYIIKFIDSDYTAISINLGSARDFINNTALIDTQVIGKEVGLSLGKDNIIEYSTTQDITIAGKTSNMRVDVGAKVLSTYTDYIPDFSIRVRPGRAFTSAPYKGFDINIPNNITRLSVDEGIDIDISKYITSMDTESVYTNEDQLDIYTNMDEFGVFKSTTMANIQPFESGDDYIIGKIDI